MTDAGRIMIIPKGKYNASTTYERLDAVTYNGQGFIALKTVSRVTPTDDGTNWKLYVDNADINVSDLAPTFTVASARENINSGEKMSTLFSKVKKYFTDIKGHAYKDLVTNATTTTVGSPLDATVAKTLNDSIGTIKNQIGSNTVKTSVPENAKFTDTTYNDATASAHGLMTAAMVTKLNGIASGANKTIVDDALSSTSTNPVQNKVVKNALDHKLNGYTVTYTVPANTGGWHKIAQISDYFNFDLYANGGWFSASKSMAHFQIQNIHGKIRIVQLSGKVLPNANNGIAKIRMVRVSDDVDTWILEEYSPSSINVESYMFTMAGSLKLTPLDGSVDSTTSFKDSVSLDVIDIPTGHVITTGSVDSAMSDTSEHPVQNKVIKAYVDKKASENVDFSTSTSKSLKDSIEASMLVTNATKNLFASAYDTITLSGITCTNNGDGTYTFNGTATDSIFFNINKNISINKGTKYKVVCFKDEDYIQNKITSCVRRVDTTAEYVFGNGTFVSDTENCWLWIQIAKGVTVSNLVAKPMITTDLDATYDDFVPYDGYEIKSCGKNLLDPNAAGTYDSPHSENGVTFTKNNDGSWTINGTATANVGVSIGYSGGDHTFIELEADAKAFLYGPSGLSGVSYGFYSNEGKQVLNDGIIPKGTKVRNLWISANIGSTLNNVKVFGVISYDLDLADTMYVPYQESTVHITPSTEFPLLGLKSFDGETNIISPGNVEVTYAKSESGAAIVDVMESNETLISNTINHNIPRVVPKDVTSYISDGSFYKRLNGSDGYSLFEDIFVGDYIKMSRAISAPNQDSSVKATGSQYVTIIGLDTLMGNGDGSTYVNYHHAIMTPGQGFGGTQHFGRHRMNPTNTTTGGYVSSEMNTAVIGAVATSGSTADTATINQQLYAEFGSHLATTRELVSNSINATGTNRLGAASGCSNNWTWASMQAILMSEIEVYGSIAFSSSGYDTGNAKMQMPLFAHNRQAINNRSSWYWLKDIASAADFCYCSNYGSASFYSASNVGEYVRPRFVIKA